MSPNSNSLETWIRELPKIELHLHLEGSMAVKTVKTLIDRHGADPSGVWPAGLPEAFSFVDFPDFGRQFLFGLSLLRTGEDLAIVVEDLANTLASQNVRYAEVTTTAFSHFLDKPAFGTGLIESGMSAVEYRDGLDEGRRRAARRGVDLNWIVDIPRDLEMPDSTVTIDYLESANTPDGLIGIGLGGYEVGFPAAPYTDHFARAVALGLHSLPHAGETEGADSVRSALEDLGAERIGHGVRCLEDPEVVEMLIDRNVMLEVCPTSNALLGVVDTLEGHPLPTLKAAGVRVCLNTDDPGWFATDLISELMIASVILGIDRADHVAMQLDAVSAAYMPPQRRAAIETEIRQFVGAAPPGGTEQRSN